MTDKGEQPAGHPPEALRAIAHRAATQRWELLRIDLRATSNYEVTFGVVTSEGISAIVDAASVMQRENLHRIVTALQWQREYGAIYRRIVETLQEYAVLATGKDVVGDELQAMLDRDASWILMPRPEPEPTEKERRRAVDHG